MDKLLHWSIANQQGDKEAISKAGQPDPKLLQQLFGGGPDEPTLMVEAMKVIRHPEATLENKLIAFENFEMLIENLDNANNIENLKLWPPLLEELEDVPELSDMALSVIGTAVQNNVNSQEAFLKHDGLSKVVKLAEHKSVKAFYALSNILRHSEDAYAAFNKCNGWSVILPAIDERNHKLTLRTLGLVTSILSTGLDEEKSTKMREIIEPCIDLMTKDANLYTIDRVLNILGQLISAGFKFTEEELAKLRVQFADIESVREQLNEDDYLIVKQVL